MLNTIQYNLNLGECGTWEVEVCYEAAGGAALIDSVWMDIDNSPIDITPIITEKAMDNIILYCEQEIRDRWQDAAELEIDIQDEM